MTSSFAAILLLLLLWSYCSTNTGILIVFQQCSLNIFIVVMVRKRNKCRSSKRLPVVLSPCVHHCNDDHVRYLWMKLVVPGTLQ